MKRMLPTVVLFAGLSLIASCTALQAQASDVNAPIPTETASPSQTITLGEISDDPAGTIEASQPLANYLAARLEKHGIRQGKVVVAPDVETMEKYLQDGVVDVFFESPSLALTAYEDIGSIPLARRWKGGVGEYSTVIVAHKDSGIKDLTGLLGRTLAFEQPGSTSGYLLPMAHLVGLGYTLGEKSDSNGPPASDEIGYVFAGNEENVLAWVLFGKAAAGTLQKTNYEDLNPTEKNQLVVLAETAAVPRQFVLSRPNLDPTVRYAITKILVEMDRTEDAQEALKAFDKTTRFEPFPKGANEEMQALQALFAPVR